MNKIIPGEGGRERGRIRGTDAELACDPSFEGGCEMRGSRLQGQPG
jgi:hypothetical protein